jgi:hypothetical protein
MSKNTTVPAYLALVAQLLETCDELGLVPSREETVSTLPENTGYCFLRFGDKSSASLIIPKSIGTMKLCDIHIDLEEVEGWVELKRPNGRVMGHIDASQVTDWKYLVESLNGASKRPTKRASSTASSATPSADMSSLLAKLGMLGKPKAKAPLISLPVIEDEVFEYEQEEAEAV